MYFLYDQSITGLANDFNVRSEFMPISPNLEMLYQRISDLEHLVWYVHLIEHIFEFILTIKSLDSCLVLLPTCSDHETSMGSKICDGADTYLFWIKYPIKLIKHNYFNGLLLW